jgi:hypothetical protein|tara:strand:- start:13038 stop:13931 length:894 start_codon:yes stop_codon:yes gene_type:complete
MENTTKITELVISEENEELSIDAISLVTSPAIEVDFIFFGKEKNNLTFSKVDEEKRMLISPALIPDKSIFRYDPNTDSEYYVYFSKETVRKASQLYLKHNNHHKATYQHQDRVSGVLTVESWIKEGKQDKSNLYGFDLPIGTWFVTMKIQNDELWQRIKEGELRGLSIEGYFVDRMEAMSKPVYSDEDILQELAEMLNLKSYTDYPKGASQNAERALIENEKLGNKATATGLQKGRRIAAKSGLSLKTIKNIFNYLKNAKKSSTEDWNDYGTIAYNLYGGDAMYRWCKKIIENQTSK